MLNEKQVALFLLAIENLDKEIGDWTQEAIIDHLKSNQELIRGYLMQIIDLNDNINSEGVTTDSEQVYATIRKGTRYESQCDGKPFPVRFELSSDGYHWKGGLGGQYRISDLILYKQESPESLYELYPTFHQDEPLQVIRMALSDWGSSAATGQLNPEWIEGYSKDLCEQLTNIAKTARAEYPEEEDEGYV